MLREQVITEWNGLKEIIKGNQQYFFGKILRAEEIRITAPHITSELFIAMIKQKIESNYQVKKTSTLINILTEPYQKAVFRTTFDSAESAQEALKKVDNNIRQALTELDY
jgi:hypothetical protein